MDDSVAFVVQLAERSVEDGTITWHELPVMSKTWGRSLGEAETYARSMLDRHSHYVMARVFLSRRSMELVSEITQGQPSEMSR